MGPRNAARLWLGPRRPCPQPPGLDSEGRGRERAPRRPQAPTGEPRACLSHGSFYIKVSLICLYSGGSLPPNCPPPPPQAQQGSPTQEPALGAGTLPTSSWVSPCDCDTSKLQAPAPPRAGSWGVLGGHRLMSWEQTRPFMQDRLSRHRPSHPAVVSRAPGAAHEQ